jgi:hypothetical protein
MRFEVTYKSNDMQYGEPPSWRPDHERLKAEAYRGTVRDALGGLRNLEQLLGSLRVGPRALLTVLPDVQACCSPLDDAITGLSSIIAAKLIQASSVVLSLSESSKRTIATLSNALKSANKSTFNAKSRLLLEQVVKRTSRDIEACFELIELLGEAAWGRTMTISLAEMAREAFRTTAPTGVATNAIRLTLSADIPNIERNASPRALVLILNHLVRWNVRTTPELVPRVVFSAEPDKTIAVRVLPVAGVGETRWATGRCVLPETEECLHIAAKAMSLRLDSDSTQANLKLVFVADDNR